jgi:DNA-binding transcriptional LysR family regulator
MESFVRVVRAKSFSTAARELGLSRALVTKHVQALEEHLGARLLNRTTRSLNLTEIGAEYYDFCRRIIGEIEDEERGLRDLQKEPRGSLRILSPKSFAGLHMSEAVAAFAKQYPDIHVTFVLDDSSLHAINLVSQGYDVAVRLAAIDDSSLMARKLATLKWVACASPAYLKRHGEPKTPRDLAGRNCLTHMTLGPDRVWRFEDGKRTIDVKVQGTLTANSVIALQHGARAGIGVAILPTYCAWDDLKRGLLKPILTDYRLPERPLYAVYPYGAMPPKKVRLFVDFMAGWFKTPRWEAARKNKLTPPSRRARPSASGSDRSIGSSASPERRSAPADREGPRNPPRPAVDPG